MTAEQHRRASQRQTKDDDDAERNRLEKALENARSLGLGAFGLCRTIALSSQFQGNLGPDRLAHDATYSSCYSASTQLPLGTDLLYAAATKTGGSLIHGLANTIDWMVFRRLATGSVPSTAVMLLILSHFDVNGAAMRELITTVLSDAFPDRRPADLPQQAIYILCGAGGSGFHEPDCRPYSAVRGGVGVMVSGWRKRHRRRLLRTKHNLSRKKHVATPT